MKQLITLILSAALLCPMWAGAQSTPKVIANLAWTVASLPISTTTPPTCVPGTTTTTEVFSQPTCTTGANGQVSCTLPTFTTQTTPSACSQPTNVTANLTNLYVSPVSFQQSGVTYYSMLGSATATYNNSAISLPTNGTMIESGSAYTWTPYVGNTAITCVLSAATLSGTCSATTNGTLYTKAITLVSDTN